MRLRAGSLLVAVVLSTFTGVLARADTVGGDTDWYSVVAANGAVIGYASEQITRNADGTSIVDSQHYDLWERGSSGSTIAARTERKLDGNGRTFLIVSTTEVNNDATKVEAAIADSVATITRTTSSGTHTAVVPLPAGVSFDTGDERLRSWDPVAVPHLEFDNLNVDAMLVEHISMQVLSSDGPDLIVLRRRYDGTDLRAVARLSLDRERRIIAIAQPMFGTEVITKRVDKETALRGHPPYSALGAVMVKSPYRIPVPATVGHIRYRFSFVDDLEFALPETAEQRVTVGPGEVTLDICSDCGPGLPNDAASVAQALKPTAWLQSDSPIIKNLVANIARLKTSDTRKMELLSKKAQRYLGRIDFAGHFSALDTLKRRAGDCTEAAVLLAAFGRAAGIPTKVADGLVYSRERYHGVSNTFMPHSWVLAYVDGKWRSFDAALFVFDTTHIAITIGDGDARSISASNQLAGLLKWDSMAEVKTKSSN